MKYITAPLSTGWGIHLVSAYALFLEAAIFKLMAVGKRNRVYTESIIVSRFVCEMLFVHCISKIPFFLSFLFLA